MPKVRRLRQIYRIDYPPRRDHAWIVQWRHRGQITISRRFSDGRYGGKRQALAAAIQFRDIALPKREALRYEHWRRGRKRSHNTSGIIGVGRYECLNHDKRSISVYWLASWNDLTVSVTNGDSRSSFTASAGRRRSPARRARRVCGLYLGGAIDAVPRCRFTLR